MKIFSSIQVKLILFLLVMAGVVLGAGAYSLYNFSLLASSTSYLYNRQIPVSHGLQQSLLALEDSSSALGYGIAIDDFSKIQQIRDEESRFNQASIRFEMYVHAMILGSNSEEFKKSHGGVLYVEWLRSDLANKEIPALSGEQGELLSQADEYFDRYYLNCIKVFSNEKKILRLKEGSPTKELASLSAEHATLINTIKEDKQKAIDLMKQLVTLIENSSNSEIQNQTYLISNLQFSNIVIPIIFSSLALLLGITIIRILILKPIKQLTLVSQKIAHGDLSVRAQISSSDEIGNLGVVFNNMVSSLQSLQENIKEKTQELSLNMQELIKKNTVSENTEKAVMNILEDSKELEGQLKIEKENIEKKILESERRAYQSEVLKELNERIGYSLDLAKIIEIITSSVGRLLDYHIIAYMTESKDKILFKCDIKEPVNHAFVTDIKSKMVEAFTAMLGKNIKVEDIDESITGAIFNEEAKEPVHSFFNLPLVIGEKVVGLITIASPKEGLYDEEETAILYSITAQASNAVTKLNEVLEREKGKLNSMVSTLDDGVFMVDPHWNLLVLNTQAKKLLGLPEGEIGVFDVLDKLSGKIDIRTKIEKAVAENTAIEPAEVTFGEKIVQIVILQVKDKNQESLGAVVIFHDVTKDRQARKIIEAEVINRTKQLKEEQIKLRASIDSLNMGFLIVDPLAEVVMINPLAKRILCSAQHEELNGVINDPKTAVSECKMADIEKELKTVFDLRSQINDSIKQRKPIEFKNLAYKNLFLHIYISPIVIMDQKLEVIGAVVLVEDITEAKVMERSKDEFFSIASHELRTPLTAIRGNTSMIKQFYVEQLKDADLKGMIDDIHNSSIRLIEIVNDFLDVSRLEQGKIEYKKEAFDASGLALEVTKELTDIAAEKKVYVKVEPGSKVPLVFADRNKIKEVLLNLAGNSVKFTETGGVTIKLESDAKFVKVLVSDTGRGIPIPNQALLFHKFQQAGSSLITRDTTKGTGLGLYISKLMIEGMGGQIKLEKSEEGKGSTFSFTIPVATPEQQVAKKAVPAAPSVPAPTVVGVATPVAPVSTIPVKPSATPKVDSASVAPAKIVSEALAKPTVSPNETPVANKKVDATILTSKKPTAKVLTPET